MKIKSGKGQQWQKFETDSGGDSCLEHLQFISFFSTSIEFYFNRGFNPFEDGNDFELLAQQCWNEACSKLPLRSYDWPVLVLVEVWFYGGAFEKWYHHNRKE